jgi:hypothetical protein
MNKSDSRLINLDFLRGIFLIFALDEHFTYYVNMWFVEYFRDSSALDSTYSMYSSMIGKQIPTDSLNYILGISFIPWVSQVYLTLACFNLAKRTQTDFGSVVAAKLKTFLLILIFFIMENFIVAPDTGQAISIYPIMVWMVIMSGLSLLYSKFGIKGILTITGISFLRFFIPIESYGDNIQIWMVENVHKGFEYDARIEYFLTSGCFGFILGYIHYHKKEWANKKDVIAGFVGLILFLTWVLIGEPVVLIPTDAFAREHDWATTLSGSCFLWGAQLFVISLFLWLEKINIKINIKFVNWVGVNSIFVFALHRVLFVKIVMPLSLLFGTYTGHMLSASLVEMYTYVSITLGLCYLIKRFNIYGLIFRD